MRDGRKKSAALIAAAASFTLVGSGCSHNTPAKPGAVAPIPISVNLTEIVLHNPDYLLIQQTDAALAVYRAAYAANNPADLLPSIDANQAYRPEAVELSSEPGYSEEELKDRLDISGAKRLSALTRRLDRSDELAVADSLDKERSLESDAFDLQRRDLELSGFNSDHAIMAVDSEKRLNLNLQIGALTANQDIQFPRNAPDGHWSKLLAERVAELDALDKERLKALATAVENRHAAIETLRVKLSNETVAKVAAIDRDLSGTTAKRVAEYRRLLGERRAGILAVARAFDQELVADLRVNSENSDTQAPVVSAGLVVDEASIERWRGRLKHTIDQLTNQRARQYALVEEETRRTVLDLAKKQNYNVVSWQPSMERKDLTLRVLQELKGRGWTN